MGTTSIERKDEFATSKAMRVWAAVLPNPRMFAMVVRLLGVLCKQHERSHVMSQLGTKPVPSDADLPQSLMPHMNGSTGDKHQTFALVGEAIDDQ